MSGTRLTITIPKQLAPEAIERLKYTLSYVLGAACEITVQTPQSVREAAQQVEYMPGARVRVALEWKDRVDGEVVRAVLPADLIWRYEVRLDTGPLVTCTARMLEIGTLPHGV